MSFADPVFPVVVKERAPLLIAREAGYGTANAVPILPDRRGIVAHVWPPLPVNTATSDVTDTDVVRPDRKPDINVSCARNGLAH